MSQKTVGLVLVRRQYSSWDWYESEDSIVHGTGMSQKTV